MMKQMSFVYWLNLVEALTMSEETELEIALLKLVQKQALQIGVLEDELEQIKYKREIKCSQTVKNVNK